MDNPVEGTYDSYAEEVMSRFDQFRNWTIAHWPSSVSSLARGDFSASERELKLLLGAKLHAYNGTNEKRENSTVINQNNQDKQYKQITPMPWP